MRCAFRKFAENRRNFDFLHGKTTTGKETAEISPIFRFLTDFGAILGTENGPEIDKKRLQKTVEKKTGKNDKNSQTPGRFGGLAEAAGEVRRGPSLRVRQDSGKDPCMDLTRQAPRWGTANLNRCAETAAPQKRGRKIMGRRNCWEATGQNLIQTWVIWTT